MSGHSKWAQIKHKKGVTDQKRGQLFSKLLNVVAVAARDNPDPEFNPRLRAAMEKARAANVPGENIERAIKKSAEAKNLDEVTIEAYGPGGTAMIIIGITDNKNRTIAEVKNILSEAGAKMADPGSVLWSFDPPAPTVPSGPAGGGEWQPKFKQPATEETKQKIAALTERLEEREDVEKVVTNLQL
ncbi:MAG: hypothetical protein CEO19_417 [Parcubacteria group bacterium Gr01-1014_73]|nr:MAG: hypothetical protein CEO19_417 [Parcubacteria group bacterium Gr01-1014_73]